MTPQDLDKKSIKPVMFEDDANEKVGKKVYLKIALSGLVICIESEKSANIWLNSHGAGRIFMV